MPRTCLGCGADISERHINAIRCADCAREREREHLRERYANDPEYRERKREYDRERYANDPEYRERNREYKQEHRAKRKEYKRVCWITGVMIEVESAVNKTLKGLKP